mmetsp:Transcript_21878/g.51679  ORF Transcript_21878/g.51679 Transcript_21878/m.51679 type:complete len:268 (+) Transcript_21878:109-912(+)
MLRRCKVFKHHHDRSFGRNTLVVGNGKRSDVCQSSVELRQRLHMRQLEPDGIFLGHGLHAHLSHVVRSVDVATIAPIGHGLEAVQYPILAQFRYGQVEAPGAVGLPRDGNVFAVYILEPPLGILEHKIMQLVEWPVKDRIQVIHGDGRAICSSLLDACAFSRQNVFLPSFAILIRVGFLERYHGVAADLREGFLIPDAAGVAGMEEDREGAPREGTEEVIHGVSWNGSRAIKVDLWSGDVISKMSRCACRRLVPDRLFVASGGTEVE